MAYKTDGHPSKFLQDILVLSNRQTKSSSRGQIFLSGTGGKLSAAAQKKHS
jgi:hypothetical protein